MKLERFEKVEFVTDHPVLSQMLSNTIYLEGDSFELEKIYYAFFLCPCGCSTLIALPVYTGLKRSKPSWNITSLDPVTIAPSILQLNGCKSHFFITQNKVKWC